MANLRDGLEKKTLTTLVSSTAINRIDQWIDKYPVEQKKSAVMAALRIAQEENQGYLTTELMNAVAQYLGMPNIAVYEVATFYSMYEHKPIGKYQICICNSISCMLNESEDLFHYLEERLGVKPGEVAQDGRFSIKEVECLGACTGAPMMMIGKEYYENLTHEKVDKILENLD